MSTLLQTEYNFELPLGYVDEEGNLHKHGVMRLACAADEILPMKDARVQNNPSYLTVVVLSRVVKQLGTLNTINTRIIESLFSADFNYLQSMYNKINQYSQHSEITCPKCEHKFRTEVTSLGEA